MIDQLPGFVPDVAPNADAPSVAPLTESSAAGEFGGLVDALGAVGGALTRADHAERAFAAGTGDLTAAVVERAQADALLSIAQATASRAAQAITTVMQMQV